MTFAGVAQPRWFPVYLLALLVVTGAALGYATFGPGGFQARRAGAARALLAIAVRPAQMRS